MAAKSYSLEFGGYWREPNIGGMPKVSGVYCVYACTYSASEKTVSIRKLVYIGEAANVNERVAEHEKWEDWRTHLKPGEVLCLSSAPVSSTDRERVEAALIFHYKPPENEEFKDSFPFDSTTISTKGRNALLDTGFTVNQT